MRSFPVMVAGAPAIPSAPAVPRAMVSKSVDLLFIGGLSLAVTVLILAFGRAPFDQQVPALATYTLTAVVTWPHFLASYRLLYSSRDQVLAYKRASLYFPIALAAYSIFAVTQCVAHPVHIQLLGLAAGVYLARHYTGQTWGMMASFSGITGTPFTAGERRIARLSLDMIMTWQILWAIGRSSVAVWPSVAPWVQVMNSHWMYVDVLGVASFALGLLALVKVTRRLGRLPDARVLVPWLALYGWYALLRKDPTTLVVVQLAHALQYLIFPLRIEENRRQAHPAQRIDPRRAIVWLAGLCVVSLAVFAGIPQLFSASFADAQGVGEVPVAFTAAFVYFVNIHHYFIDGCLYKLRNPAVRRDLFAHLAPAKQSA